jgi:hypothetical protein
MLNGATRRWYWERAGARYFQRRAPLRVVIVDSCRPASGAPEKVVVRQITEREPESDGSEGEQEVENKARILHLLEDRARARA